jgi:hypothetical protein
MALRNLFWMILTAAIAIAGCSHGADDDEPPVTNQPPVTAPATAASAAISSSAGGTVELADVGKVSFAPNVLPAHATVTVSKTTRQDVADAFAITGPLFAATNRVSHEMTVTLDVQQPTGEVAVELPIPAELGSVATAQDEVRAFYLNEYIDEEISGSNLQQVEVLPTRGLPTDPTLQASIPREAFQPNAEGKYEAHVFLALTPTAPVQSTVQQPALSHERPAVASGDIEMGQIPARQVDQAAVWQ